MIKLTDFKFFANTDGEMYVSVADLKKRLKEEYQVKTNENRIPQEIDVLIRENEDLSKIIKMQDEEISELRKDLIKRQNLEESFSKTVKQFDKKLEKTVKLERAEAVKEFSERLCEDRVSNDPVVIAAKCLLKEMVGENNE